VDTDLTGLATMLRYFAEQEFRGSSPLYERLATELADEPELAAPLLAAEPEHRRALLYFAATQYLLRTAAPEHPLAGYLLGGRTGDDGLRVAFADFLAGHREELAKLCATRTTQTNEPRRCTSLRPGFGLAASMSGCRPLALLELGTSAGLLLLADRYGYRYTGDGGRAEQHGRAVPELTLECAVPGGGWPEPAGTPIRVAARTGVDLNPLDPADPDTAAWLRSCVWPEHTERLRRLDAAFALARTVRPQLIRGDMVAALPQAFAATPSGAVPVVFTSHALTYLPAGTRQALVRQLHELGARRDMFLVMNEGAASGVDLFAADPRPPRPSSNAIAVVTLVAWRKGRATVTVLGRACPHGSWLEWSPQDFPYRPAALG